MRPYRSASLSLELDVTSKIPDKSAELASDRDADLRGFHLAAQAELAIALREAHLRLPGDIADGCRFASRPVLVCITPRLRDRYGDGVLMNIQSNVGSDSLVHGLSPAWLGRMIPSGPLHVARRTQLRNPRYGRQTPSSDHMNIPLAPILRAPGHEV